MPPLVGSAVRKTPRRASSSRRVAGVVASKQDNRVRELNAKLRQVRAKYEAAQTTPHNSKHWSLADALSANSANSPEVRRLLRNRSRYEVSNNSYAHGIALTLANDCIGTGPRLQLLSKNRDENDRVEALFADWAEAIDLAGKLRTARLAKFEDGEAIAILSNNPELPTSVQLDLRLVEAEQVANPFAIPTDLIDGIRFDKYGNPVSYDVLRNHPGDTRGMRMLEVDSIPAKSVLHYFTQLRPGQARGIPEITPALGLFAQLRRYTLAVLGAAEIAAVHALVLESDLPAGDEETELNAMETFELEHNLTTVLPQGYKLGQAKPEQPTNTYKEFKHELLAEIARCLNVPFNVAAGNSSSYNYASGRLDHQTYFKSLHVERSRIVRSMLDRIFASFIAEASLISGLLPQSFRTTRAIPHRWFWDGAQHVDPQKEADALETRLRSGATTLADHYASQGQDWEPQIEQRALEVKRMKELGLEVALPAPVPSPKPAAAPKDDDE